METKKLWAEIKSLKSQLNHTQKMLEIREAQIALLTQKKFQSKSEKHPLQPEINFDFNEAEVLADAAEEETLETIPAHTRRKPKSKHTQVIPEHLPRIQVQHKCESTQCPCCNNEMTESKPVIQEQVACLPSKYYVVQHQYQRLTCNCKEQAPIEAKRPERALPGTQVHALALATWIEQKYQHGLPLYRLEKIAKAANVGISRESLARWIIQVSKKYFQPMINLMNDIVLSHDICLMDETTIQVLQEPGRTPANKSYFWIRRGGKPGQESIILDYSPSRSTKTCKTLLDDFKGYIVSDAYSVYLRLAKDSNNTEFKIKNVLCSDHARRKFKEAYDSLDKKTRKGSLSDQALHKYAKIYKLEADYKEAEPPDRLKMRQTQAKDLWEKFIEWAKKIKGQGIAHEKTAIAFDYLVKFEIGLQEYLQDPRLPISNILSEHVAKHVAIARKNFLFSATPSGATASANCFSMIQTAKLHGHQVNQYLAVILTELPKAQTAEDYEAYLPWNISAEEVKLKYQALPLM